MGVGDSHGQFHGQKASLGQDKRAVPWKYDRRAPIFPKLFSPLPYVSLHLMASWCLRQSSSRGPTQELNVVRLSFQVPPSSYWCSHVMCPLVNMHPLPCFPCGPPPPPPRDSDLRCVATLASAAFPPGHSGSASFLGMTYVICLHK